MSRPSLTDLTMFQAVAAHRSFRQAADAMGHSPSSLSHAVRGLEERLGVRLLNRTTRSVSPTQAGDRLLEQISPILRDLDAALEAASTTLGQVRGTLRINCSAPAALTLMDSVLPQYLARYPEVEVDVVAEGRLVDIVSEGFDAGVRIGESLPRDMVAVPLGGELRFIAVAAPEYLDLNGAPDSPGDLRSHRCIRQRLPSGKRYRWEFQKQHQEIVIDVPGVLTLDNVALMVEAAARGLGIAYVPEPAARPEVVRGRLRSVLDDWSPGMPGLYLYFPANRHMPLPLRALVDLMKADRSL